MLAEGRIGTLVHVEEGNANTNKQFLCTAAKSGTLGSTAITFSLYQGPLQNTVLGLAAASAAGATQRLLVLNADGTLETVTAAQLKTYVDA